MQSKKESKYISCKVKEIVLCKKCFCATSILERTKGLMFKHSLGEKNDIDGMLINYCNSVHTFFMRFPLDLVFIGADNKVVKVIQNKRAWTMTWFYWKAVKVLELPAWKASGIKIDDQIEVEYV